MEETTNGNLCPHIAWCSNMLSRLVFIFIINIISITAILAQCSGTVYDSGGNSGVYSGNENITYLYSAPAGSIMELTFNSFDLEENYDYLYVYDGANTSAPLMYTLTGTDTPSFITSTGKDITLEFVSDATTNHDGWEIALSCFTPNTCNEITNTGLIAYYDFREGNGDIVHDISGYGTPLNMKILNPGNTSWSSECGLIINSETEIQSVEPANKIIDALKASASFSIEAWVKPANNTQDGPARIVTISDGTSFRNLTLGQVDAKYSSRLRTSDSSISNNGTPEVETAGGVDLNEPQQIVYSWDSLTNIHSIYVNGLLDYSGTRDGDLSNWDDTYFMSFVNEVGGSRAWLGEIYSVAIYNKSLSEEEIYNNLFLGSCCSGNPAVVADFDCDAGNEVEMFFTGLQNAVPKTLNFNNIDDVDSVLVEIVYKSSNPGNTIYVEDDNNISYPGTYEEIGSKAFIYTFNLPATSSVTYSNTALASKAQSLTAYVYRSGQPGKTYTSQYTTTGGVNKIFNLSFILPARTDVRDINIVLPVSELTYDNRVLNFSASAGTSSTSIVKKWGTDGDDFPDGCCIDSVTLTLKDVPLDAKFASVQVESPSVSGQSFVIAGLIYAEIECFDEEICDDGLDNDNDGIADCEDRDCGFLENREFDNGLNNWDLYVNSGSGNTASVIVDQTWQLSGGNSAFINIDNIGASQTDWHIAFSQFGLSIEDQKAYQVIFDAKSSIPRDIVTSVQLESNPWTSYLYETVSLTTTGDTYSYIFIATETQLNNIKLVFSLGSEMGDIWIDNVQFKEICASCFAEVSPDQTQCQNAIFEVEANTPTAGSIGTWSVISGSATAAHGWNEPKNTFTIPPGTTVLRWTVESFGACSEFDDITLTNTTGCSTDCIDPLNINNDLEDSGTITTFDLDFKGSNAALINGTNNPAGWAERYGENTVNTTLFNGAYYIDTSPNNSGDAYSGDYVIYLKGNNFCLSPLATSAGLACGKKYSFSVWVAAYTFSGTQQDAQFVLEYSAGSNSGVPVNFSPKIQLSAPASTSWNNLNWNRYVFEITIPEDGYDWSDFYFTSLSDDHGIVVDDLCITQVSSGAEAIAGADITSCTNVFALQANTPGSSYSGTWSVNDGDISISSLSSPNATATMNSGSLGSLTWTVTDGSCSSADIVILSHETLPALTPIGATICKGESAEISFSGCSGDVLWETGETTSAITVSPSVSTTYSVTCTNVQSPNLVLNGDAESAIDFENWVDWDNSTITNNPLDVKSGSKALVADASTNWAGFAQDIAVNPGEHFTLTFWAKTTNVNSVPTFEMQFLDNSWVALTDKNTIEINSVEYKQYTISAIAPLNAAFVQIIGASSKTGKLFVDDVVMTKGSDCQRTVDVDVTILDLPVVSANNDGPLTCTNQNVTLQALPAGMSYAWSGGGSGQTKSISVAGTYTVTVTDGNGCTSVASTTVLEENDIPTPSASVSGIITCNDPNSTLTASPAGLSYAWSDGGNGQTKNVTTGGYHYVTVTGDNGCSAVASVYVIADNTPPSVKLDDETACEGTTVTLAPQVCEYYPDIVAQRPLAIGTWANIYGNLRSPLKGDGELCFTLDSCNLSSAQMIGLNADPNTNNGFNNIDYAMYVQIRSDLNRTLVQIRENGTSLGNAFSGTGMFHGMELCIRRTGTTIEYLKDGVVIQTSSKESNVDIYYDHSVHSSDATLWVNGYSHFNNISLCGDVGLGFEWDTGANTSTIDVNSSGFYEMMITDAKGCIASTQANVTFQSNPIAQLENNGPVTCSNPTATLTAGPDGMSYLWEDGSTNQTRIVNSAGTFYVTVTDGNMCSDVDSTLVELLDSPTVDITGKKNLCEGETTTLSPTSGGTWASSNTSVAIVSNSGNVASIGPGTVTFKFTDSSSGCISDATEVVTVNSALSVSIDYNDAICIQDGSQLTAMPVGGSPSYTYEWEGPNGLATTGVSIDVNDSGNYYLTVTDSLGCTAETSGYVYEAYDPFIFTLSTEVCEGENVTLTVNSGSAVSYIWDSNAGDAITPSVTVTPTYPSSVYYVTVTNDLGCTSIATAEVDVKAKTNVSITGGSDICIGETTQLSPTTGGTWTSSNNSVAGVSNEGLVTGIGSGTANFVFTNSATNCESDPTTDVIVNAKTIVSITGPTTLCGGETSTLSPSTGGTWQSSNEAVATVTDEGVVTAVGQGSASFIYTNSATGCVSNGTSAITVNPLLNVNITGPDEICIGNQTYITPTSGGTWVSSNPEIATITNTGIITAMSVGTSVFTFTSSFGCTSEVSAPITVGDNISISIDGDPILCEDESQTLTASVTGGVWSSSNTSIATIDPNTGVVNGIADGNVIITYNNSSSGCYLNTEMALEIKPRPTGAISGPATICAGETTTLTASTSGTWNSNDTDVAIVSNNGNVVGIGAGTVTFYFMADNGCASEETGILTVNPDLDVEIDFGGAACFNDDMQLTANVSGGTPNFQYSWTGPGGFASNNKVIDVPINGNYNITVTDDAGCSTSTTAFVFAAYEPFIFALNTEVCEGEAVTLSVNSETVAGYQWSANAGNSTEQSVSVIPSAPSSTYYVTVTNNVGCTTVATAEIAVNTIPKVEVTGNTTICEGATTTLSPTSGGFWTSSDYSVASVTNEGVVTGLDSGTATFTFRNSTTNCISEETTAITVGNNTIVGIDGNDQLCIGIPSTLTTAASGGTWSSSNESIVTVNAMGELNPISQGTATISYVFNSNECYEDGNLEVTVFETPTVNINGPSTICKGENTFLIPTSGGTWTSSDETVAIVSNIGVVTGISGGSATFTFTSNIGCTKTLASPLTVLSSPTISFNGPSSICINENTSLSPSSGGIWISSNNNIATVNSSGIVTGKTEGTVSFTFVEFVNGCASDELLSLTVNGAPSITSPVNDELCIGESTTISPSSGGSWMSTNPSVAQITNDGIIIAIAPGAASFIYTSGLSGCSSNASNALVVEGKPSINLEGPDELCIGETTNITPNSGGNWSSTDVSVATINNAGEITAINSGEVQFIFTSNNTGCTSDSSSIITINDPISVEVSGEDRICVGETTTLLPASGGTWESSDENIASVTNSGVVFAHEPGNVSFVFNSSQYCTSNPTTAITIDPKPIVNFVGSPDICIGSTTFLSPSTGGSWISNNPSVASITNSGVVTGLTNGSATFTFTNTLTGCSANPNTTLNVYESPSISIAGADEICIGNTTNLLPSNGGSWVSDNTSIATITPSGLVTGLNGGTVTFTFTESGTGCQSSASEPITVLSKPIVFIDGDNTICEGETTTLSPSSGGSWISSDNTVATVADNGTVTGITQGIARFTFVSNEGCTSNETSPVIVFGRTETVIDGPDLICLGESTQILPNSGGTWQSTNPSIATITNTGLVNSVSSGEVRFIFFDSNTGCSSEESDIITINDLPTINITGANEICVGGTTSLVPTVGGVWSSSDPSIATIANNGTVTGVSEGTVTFTFTELISGCVSAESDSITVNSGPDITFTGSTEICIGDFTSISPSSGGVWASSNPAIATITNTGIIEGISQGSVSFIFSETGTGCVSQFSSSLTVNGMPSVSIDGSSLICIGSTTTLSPNSGGIWTSVNPAIATVTSDGIVTGIGAGSASFIFENSATGCSSDGDLTVTVGDAIPVLISGESDICIGYTTTLSPTSGGIWVSNNPEIATVTNSGLVTGKAPGKVTFEFIDASSGCTSGGVTDEIVIQNCLNHDFNVAVVNQPITGNLHTNDNISATATYNSSPILISKPSGSITTLNIDSDGTYEFSATKEGKYMYYVPVCIPPNTTGCPKSVFEINVVDNIYSVSNPVGNLEFATTYTGPDASTDGTPISINTLHNDACVYTGGCEIDSSSVTIIDAPSNGIAVVATSGIITYTPNPEFIGKDTLQYQVCVEGESKCSHSTQIITVNHSSAVNTTVPADDFGFELRGEILSGNVLANDTDPENDNTSVVAVGSLLAPVAIEGGVYFIDTEGNYIFTPNEEFTGSTDIVYTVCDDNVEIACSDATIHILIFEDMSLNIRVYLEGAMMQNGGATSTVSGRPLMRDDLRDNPANGNNYIPMTDPYTVMADMFVNTPAKYNNVGPGEMEKNLHITDSLAIMSVSGDNAIVDWVNIELRSKDDMTLPIATRSGLLQRDGDIVELDGVSSLKFQGINVDSFYVVVKHRSHLGAMSMKVSNTEMIDFTSPDFETFNFGTTKNNGNDYTGLSQKSTVVNGYNVLWAGDFDSNGKVKFTNPEDDQNVMFIDVLFNSPSFLINYDSAYGYLTGDYNMDGKTKYTNPSDDLNYLFSQILLFPNNTSYLSNFNSMIEQIPE